MAKITWFEGNDGSQNVVRRDLFSNSNSYYIASNLKRESGQNDEIRSVVLEYVPKGTKLTVYDNPDGKTNDDWATLGVSGLASNSPAPHAQVAAALGQISGAVCGTLADGIRQMSETGGRQVFPDAIQSKIYEVCFAVHEAYKEYYDDLPS